MEQRERDETLVLFANRSCTVLVATDVAARGIDIANLGAVINVDVVEGHRKSTCTASAAPAAPANRAWR